MKSKINKTKKAKQKKYKSKKNCKHKGSAMRLQDINFAPKDYHSIPSILRGGWGEKDYIILAHGGEIDNKTYVTPDKDINYFFYCPPCSDLISINRDYNTHIQMLKRNEIEPLYQISINSTKLQSLMNYKVYKDPDKIFIAGLYHPHTNHLLYEINDGDTLENITNQLLKDKSKHDNPNLYVNICQGGCHSLKQAQNAELSLEESFNSSCKI